MRDSLPLNKHHPQKYHMKLLCNMLYYLGAGDLWYEDRNLSMVQTVLYKMWEILCNMYSTGILIDELAAYSLPNLTLKEKNDLNQFSLGHPSILSKLYVLYLLRSRVKEFLKGFLEYNREYTSLELDKAAVKKGTKYCLVYNSFLWCTLSSVLIDAIKIHITEGVPIRVIVTYFPNSSHSGFFINIIRFFVEFHWWYICGLMALIDCLCICSLVYLAFRFKFLQTHFKSIREKLVENPENKSLKELEEEFRKEFVIGIQLHEDALRCANHVQHALGNLYSIQVVECILNLMITLLKLVTVERNFTTLVANLIYFGAVFISTGLYMSLAGDITIEAAMVSTSIYHCGWELTSGPKELRTMVVMGLLRSQVPVYMTAFGIFILSYENFIGVLRATYSFFAVMY